MKRLAVMDMDGTLLEARTIDALCKEFGLMDELEAISSQAECLESYEVSGAIARLFSGLRASDLERAFDGIAVVHGAKEFIHFLGFNGFITAIITESYVFLASRLAERLDVERVWGNELEIVDGIVTGRIRMPLGWKKQRNCQRKSVCKLHAMCELAKEYSVGKKKTLAIGDSKSDLCMIENAAIRVAFRPKDPEIIKAADIIVYTDFFELMEKLKPFLETLDPKGG